MVPAYGFRSPPDAKPHDAVISMISENELRQKRGIVGLLAIAGVVSAGVLLVTGTSDFVASGLLRVGLLLGAFWLVLPTKDRPAAWARVSPWSVAVIAAVGFLLPRFKYFLPVLIAGVVIGWWARPRRKNGSRQ